MCSLRHVASSPSACHENSSQKPFALLIIEPGALTSWSLLFALLIVRILSATSGGSRYLAYLVPTFNLVFVARRPPCSDIYLIFSPEVHFQLGCAGRSRRLNLGSQSRLWEIQRKREPHNISNEEYLDIIGQYRYLTKYMCPNLTLRQINISSSQLRGLIYMVHSPISLMG